MGTGVSMRALYARQRRLLAGRASKALRETGRIRGHKKTTTRPGAVAHHRDGKRGGNQPFLTSSLLPLCKVLELSLLSLRRSCGEMLNFWAMVVRVSPFFTTYQVG